MGEVKSVSGEKLGIAGQIGVNVGVHMFSCCGGAGGGAPCGIQGQRSSVEVLKIFPYAQGMALRRILTNTRGRHSVRRGPFATP